MRTLQKIVLIACSAAMLLMSIEASAQSSSPTELAYVTHLRANSVSVIDVGTNTVLQTIPLPLLKRSLPTGLAATPDGSRVYVANYWSADLSVIDVAMQTEIDLDGNPANGPTRLYLGESTYPADTENIPLSVAIDPTSTFAYVTDFGRNSDRIFHIDIVNNVKVGTIAGFSRPESVAITPDGRRAYVSNHNAPSVGVVDTNTHTKILDIGVADGIGRGVAMHPAGTRVYVCTQNRISVIDVSTNTVVGFADLPDSAMNQIVVSPDGTRVYASSIDYRQVLVYDTTQQGAELTEITRINLPSGFFGYSDVAITGDGTQVYVLYQGGVHAINTATYSLLTIPLAAEPHSIIIFPAPAAPNQPPVAVCTDVTVPADGRCEATATIDHDSYDPDADPLTLTQAPAGPYPLGRTLVTLTANDDHNAASQCTGTVTVIDETPPTIAALSVSPSVLWPPNHRMVAVTVTPYAADNCGAPTCSILEVTSNEPVDGLGDGDMTPDWQITPGSLTVDLRAERSGTGSGRMYTITVQCQDATRHSHVATGTVMVPRGRGKR